MKLRHAGRWCSFPSGAAIALLFAVLVADPFIAIAGAGPNLHLAVTDSPDPVSVGELLTYRISITNASADNATGITLTADLTTNATLFSAQLSQGSYTTSSATVVCNLGGVVAGGTATVSLVVTPLALGVLTNSFVVTETEADSDPTDNSAVTTTIVSPLTLFQGPALNYPRYRHTATLLADGRVLIAGGLGFSGTVTNCELYDPASKTFTLTGSLPRPMYGHRASLLQDGTVLLTGGSPSGNTAVIYNPTSGTCLAISNMVNQHVVHTSTLLPDGRVLIASGSPANANELYIPSRQSFTNIGPRLTGSAGHCAFLLTNGTVAILGGNNYDGSSATNDIWDIATGVFTPIGLNLPPAYLAGGAQLNDGRFLLAGGSSQTTAGIFDPLTTNYVPVGPMVYMHPRATANRLADGRVFVTGADFGGATISDPVLRTPELYDPVSATFSRTAPLKRSRQDHTATLLNDGTVLIAGGYYSDWMFYNGGSGCPATTEIYDPVRTKTPPVIYVSDASVLEGDSGTTDLVFPMTLSTAVGLPVSVKFELGGGENNIDFLNTNGIATFAPGETNSSFTITVYGDRHYEYDESFAVLLTNPSNAVLNVDRPVGTILNDDDIPTVSAPTVSGAEGNTGITNFVFNVSLSETSVDPISVDYFTSDGTAVAGNDYLSTNGTLIFDPGMTNISVTVYVKGDITTEPDETFYLNLTNVIGAHLPTTTVTATILNDDAVAGRVDHFDLSTVTSPQHLAVPFPLTITAKDYAGQVVSNFSGGVTIWGAVTNAPSQEFTLEEGDFSQWTPLNVGNAPGPYQMLVADVAGHGTLSWGFRLCPNSGTADGITRPIQLLGGVVYTFSVDAAVTNQHNYYPNADASTAHIQINGQEIGSFNFNVLGWIYPAQCMRTNVMGTFTAPTNGTYQISLLSDRGYGETEVWSYFDNLRVSAAPLKPKWVVPFTNGVWSGTYAVTNLVRGLSLIAEDAEAHTGVGNPFDVAPAADLVLQATNNPTLVRAGSDVVFTATLTNRGPSTASNVVVSTSFAGDIVIKSAANNFGTANVVGNSIIYSIGTLTNGRLVTLTATVRPHVADWFTNVTSATADTFDAELLSNTVLIPVLPDIPVLHLANYSVVEGDSGISIASVPVWLDGPVGQTLSVDYTTANGTAGALDYVATNGTLAFPPDVVTQYVSVLIRGDTFDEPDETFTLNFSNPTNAVLVQTQAIVTIVDNDPLPIVSIGDITVAEGNSGNTAVQFPVTLSNPSSSTVTITCTTTNGTATAPNDYISATSALNFASGVTTQMFTVYIVGDLNNEPDQWFNVVLSSPVNCAIGRGTATGTITNDDAAPGKLLRFGFDPISAPEYIGRAFPITIRALDHLDQPASFSGTAVLTAQSDSYYIRRLFADFEDGSLAGWTNNVSGTMTVSNVTDVATNGTHSLRVTGKSSTASDFYGLRYFITNSRPNKVSFYVRSAQTNAICGRFWAAGGAGYRAFDFYMNKDGRMGLYNNTTSLATTPYTSNRWYRVDLDLTWGATYSARKVNCSIDGVPLVTNLNFLDDTYSGLDWVTVQNTDVATSWFDDIHVYDSFATNLVITPSNLTSFVSGVWTGNVVITQAAPNVYLTVTDNSEHIGQSTNFDVTMAALQLIAPAALTEGDVVASEVRVPVPFPQSLVVKLTSSVPAELTVPASVTIPAGQTNAVFNVTAVDDIVLDGSQFVTVTASGTNLVSASSLVSVNDNEVAILTLTVPSNVVENAGILANQGVVTASAPPAKPAIVTLTSSDTNVVQVPASVIIPSNQVSVTFPLTIINNRRIEAPRYATISATAPNWTNDSKLITVSDDEDLNLHVTGPTQVSEEIGNAYYTAFLSGTLDTNLALTFASSDTNVITVSSSTIITAGQTSAVFVASVVDNMLYDGAKTVSLSAAAGGFGNGTLSVTVLDNEVHHLGFSAITGPQTNSVPFTVTVSARDIFDGPVTALSGAVTLVGSNAAGSCLLQPTNITLVNGTWTGSVTVFSSNSPVTLHATSWTGVTGQSQSFVIGQSRLFSTAIGAGDLAYSPISQRLWALVSSNNTLVPIDPVTSFVEPGVSVGPAAGHVVTSGDGRYLHIVGNSGLWVRRFDTLSRTIDLTWSNGAYTVNDIAVQPGNPNVVAVSWVCGGCSPSGHGVVLYEGGVARTNAFGVNLIEFGESPDRLYGYNNDSGTRAFRVAQVDASGLVDIGTLPILGSYSDEFMIAGGTLFARNGAVYDPDTAVQFTSGNDFWGGVADKGAGRFYTIDWYTIGPLTAYDLATMLPVATVNLPGPYSVSALTRWGGDGLAFCSGGKVVVMHTDLLPTAPATDLRLSAATTNVFVLSGNTVLYNMTVQNDGPSPCTNAALSVLLPDNISLAGVAVENGWVKSQSSHSLVCVITNLPVGAAPTVSLTLLGGLPGNCGARVSLTEDNVDLNRTNNLLPLTFQVGYAAPPDSVVELHQPSSDLAWNSNAAKIVIAAQNIPLATGNSLLLLDPLTAHFDDPIPCGFGPNHLSVHPAGRYIYAALDGESAVTRVDLQSHAVDLKFKPPHTVNDLAVKPDDARIVALTDASWPQVLVYSNGIQLPTTVDPGADLRDRFIEFSSTTPDILYLAVVDGFARVQITGNGATTLNGLGGMISGYDRDMRCNGGRVFTAGGRVFDAEAQTFIGTVPYSGLVAPDVDCGRVFYLSGSGTSYVLTSLNFTNLQFVGSVAITNVSGTPTSLIRWGTDGLAFRTTGGQIFLIRTTLADDRDNDGLPDSWELNYFASINSPESSANDDPDGDGITNLQEWRAGLNPLSYDPVRFLAQQTLADGAFQITALGRPSDNYSLFASTNLIDWIPVTNFTCTNVPTILVDPGATNFKTRFYRLGPQSGP